MRDLIDDCVHCGFCLPTCPTYQLWHEEMDSPRGRIVLMGEHEDTATLSDAMVTHFDRCLGCMACVTACPSGVQYDKLIVGTRAAVQESGTRSRRERLLRRGVYGLFTHPGRLRPLVPLTDLGRRVGAVGVAARSRVPLVRALGQLAPRLDARRAREPTPAVTPAGGPSRGRAALLQGCVQRAFFGDVNAATARVLAAEGWEVHAPDAPRCCGALQYHEGDHEEARDLAQQTIDALNEFDVIVTNAAGCGSAMKEYGHLIGDGRSMAFAERVKDVTEVLAAEDPRADRKPVEMKVAYHDACHLAHAQGIRQPPRELLRGIPGLELVEPAEPEICCGSAGIYNLLQPKAAGDLGRRKAERLLATGAEAVAAANPGCTLQITAHTAAQGQELPVYHPVQLLDASIAGKGAP
jgi:glycolate dehydrogenase iron-sulfur subunit